MRAPPYVNKSARRMVAPWFIAAMVNAIMLGIVPLFLDSNWWFPPALVVVTAGLAIAAWEGESLCSAVLKRKVEGMDYAACPQWGYDLTGHKGQGSTCPECGTDFGTVERVRRMWREHWGVDP